VRACVRACVRVCVCVCVRVRNFAMQNNDEIDVRNKPIYVSDFFMLGVQTSSVLLHLMSCNSDPNLNFFPHYDNLKVPILSLKKYYNIYITSALPT